jgi:hypothetical protein
MRAAFIALTLATFAPPAFAQDYYSSTANVRHGNGYTPSTIVAGWEGDESFAIIALAPDGNRIAGQTAAQAAQTATDWKAILITGPRAEAEDDNEEDERYADKLATNPKKQEERRGPPAPRRETTYRSTTCPAVMQRMASLKPLTGFEFDPPLFKGNQDGGAGDGREGYDLWIRVGDAELNKSAETKASALGAWFEETMKALAACPSTPSATG